MSRYSLTLEQLRSLTNKALSIKVDKAIILKLVNSFNKKYTRELDISVTGARPGDIIFGEQKCVKSTTIRVHNDFIRPMKKHLDEIREENMWNSFLHRLSEVPFFSKMSIKERDIWMEENESIEEFISMDPSDKLKGEVLDVGEGNMKNLDSETIDKLMDGNNEEYYTFEEIENFFPVKPGGKGRKHVLIFLKWFWRLSSDCKYVDSFTGVIYDIEKGRVYSEYKSPDDKDLVIVDNITGKKGNQSVAFVIPKEQMKIDEENTTELIVEIYNEISFYGKQYICETKNAIKNIRKEYVNYTAAGFKAAIQKLIRFGATCTTFDNPEIKKIDTKLVLLVTCGLLAENSGSFVPDIQRYVTGLESFAKRLGVICGFEDTYIEEERVHELLSLFSGGLLAQRVRSWRPSKNIMKNWLITAVNAYKCDKAVLYDFNEGLTMKKLYISNKLNIPEHCSALLDELKTFEGDIGMARYIAYNYSDLKTISSKKRFDIMPICHTVDHHWSTSMIYFYSTETIYKTCNTFSTGKPFRKIFHKLFDEVIGVNPRRLTTRITEKKIVHNEDEVGVYSRYCVDKGEEFEKDDFVYNTRSAQCSYLIALKHDKIDISSICIKENKFYNFEYKLDFSWLAGLVGAIEIKGFPATLVTMRPDNPYQLIAIRKPCRNTKENITPEREESSKKIARQLLKNGISLSAIKAPCEILKGKKVFLVKNEEGEDLYLIGKTLKDAISWESICNLKYKLPVYKSTEFDLNKTLLIEGKGIEENADVKLQDLCTNTDRKILYRVLYYIDNFKARIDMNRISRDGSGTYQSVTLEDVGAYQFLLNMVHLYPCAITCKKYTPASFDIQNGPLFWKITRDIKKFMSQDNDNIKWKKTSSKLDVNPCIKIDIHDKLERNLWCHQKEDVQEMISSYHNGIKASFLFSPVGLGKTLSVMYFLKHLFVENKLPKYIIYTLPSSAIKSIIHEITSFGFEVNYIIPLKNTSKKDKPENVTISKGKDSKLVPFCINLIEHDHVKHISKELIEHSTESVFICDEVHKALNETQRTSTCLEIAHLSKVLIVLTGTPIIDNKIYKLIWWLEQIVQFEVNVKNCLVAANSMIARKASTGIKVELKEVRAQFTKKELEKHKTFVPLLMGGTNTYPTIQDFNSAGKLCYEVCDRRMIQETIEHLDEGVMLVAKSKEHQLVLKNMLTEENIDEKDIFIITGDSSIFLTDEYVENNKVHPYKVVITTVKKSTGYTLTYLGVIIEGVYPSNQADRDQIHGRINRIGQRRKIVKNIVVHCGFLSFILKNHNDAKSWSVAISDIAKSI